MSTKTTPKKAQTTAIANANDASPSERFTMAVIKEFPNGMNGQAVELTSFKRNLIQNYVIKLDSVLKEAETKRMSKQEQYRDALPLAWSNVNMHKLAQDVVAYSSIGLDPLQKNHIHPIPYKNSKTNQYDINLMEGFNGLELKARKYGFDVPDEVIFELKYSTDIFKSKKKNASNEIETYDYEITDDFNRGELEGGFYYKIFRDHPEKNKLVVMNRAQIEKRKPKYASAEFWGGEKDAWENGKKSGKETIEGWEEEMFMKTLKRHCWNDVNIDSQKIDDFLMRVLENETQSNDRIVEEAIQTGTNKKEIGFDNVEDAEEIQEGEDFEALHNQAIEAEKEEVNQDEPGF